MMHGCWWRVHPSLRHLNIPLTSLNTDVRYLLKTADGKRSNAAIGTLKLNLFFQNQENIPVCAKNVIFIVVSDNFKMHSNERVGIIGSSFFSHINASLHYTQDSIILSGKFHNLNDQLIHTSILCHNQTQLSQCHAVSLQVAKKDSGKYCGKIELKLPEILHPSIYHIQSANNKVQNMSFSCPLPASSTALIRSKNNSYWPLPVNDTLICNVTFLSLDPEDIPTKIDDLNSLRFNFIGLTSSPKYIKYLRDFSYQDKLSSQNDFFPKKSPPSQAAQTSQAK